MLTKYGKGFIIKVQSNSTLKVTEPRFLGGIFMSSPDRYDYDPDRCSYDEDHDVVTDLFSGKEYDGDGNEIQQAD